MKLRDQLRRWSAAAALAALLIGIGQILSGLERTTAQGGGLPYNSIVSGRIDSTMPLGQHTFSGSAGDLVTVRALGVGGALNPSLTLLAPDGSPVAGNDEYVLSDRITDAFLSVFLPQTGTYQLLVGSSNGTQGDYLLQLAGRSPVIAETLDYDTPVRAEVPLDPPPQYWQFTAGNCPTTLTITNETGGDPFTFPYSAIVRDERGVRVGELRGGRALQNRLTVPANSGRYEIEIGSIDALSFGTLLLTITCADRQPDCNLPVPQIAVPPTPTPTPTAPAGQMLLIQSGGILTYPSQDVFNALTPGSPMVAYQFTGSPGDWISAEVISLDGVDPYMTLLGPSAAPITSSNDARFGLAATDAYLSATLIEPGTYTLLVGAQNGTAGNYLLRFTGRTPVVSTPLGFGVPVTVTIPPPSPITPPPNDPQYFTFEAQDCPTTLTITGLGGTRLDPLTFPFTAIVRDARGAIVARMQGGRAEEARLTVAPRSGIYEVELRTMNPTSSGQVELLVSCGGDAPRCGQFTGLPVSTPRPGWTPNRPTRTPTRTPTGPTATPTNTPTLPPCPPDTVVIPGPGILPLNLTEIPGYVLIAPTLLGTPETPTQTQTPCATITPTPPPVTRPPVTRVPVTPVTPTLPPPPPPVTPSDFCGDGVCSNPELYNCGCQDCANNPIWISLCLPTSPPDFCGDGVCSASEIASCQCRQDCANNPTWLSQCIPTVPPPPVCGNGICEPGEDFVVCDPNILTACVPICGCPDCNNQGACYMPP